MAWLRRDQKVEHLQRELEETRARLDAAVAELQRRTSVIESQLGGRAHPVAAPEAIPIAVRPAPASVPQPAPPPGTFPLGDADADEIRSLIARGHQIQAIKKYREATGAGLKESRDAVEEMARWR